MENLKELFLEEDAIGVVEIILILVVLIALVLLFKTNIESVIKSAFEQFSKDSKKIIGSGK